MNYHRYVIAPTTNENIHGMYSKVSRIWSHDDGTSLFKVECDDEQFTTLNADTSLIVLPSLDAPADRLSAPVKTYFDTQSVTAATGDTLINMLRKVRSNSADRAHVLIDKPH